MYKRTWSTLCRFLTASVGLWTVTSHTFASEIDFQRQIQPILTEHCTHCHGGDEASRKGELRLDVRETALQGGESDVASIVPNKPDESELVKRILSKDPDQVMPPPHEKKPLNESQITLLKQWIQDGAHYDQHWSFNPPRKDSIKIASSPIDFGGVASNHPIDSLIAKQLTDQGLKASPPANKYVLCRRIYLDIIGLPPTPEQLEQFEKDGVEKTIDALLASERYGEKWARHWLDVARYSDTNGYEKDVQRNQWAWRDWLIASLNKDLPYNQFIVEQIAGDLLSDATQDQIVATGFLRNSMINEEGAIVPEQFRMVEMFDRMDCIGKAFLGLSLQCAQCHNHKFDPITQEDYYRIFSFLNNSYEAQSQLYTQNEQNKIKEIESKKQEFAEQIKLQKPSWNEELIAWTKASLGLRPLWQPLKASLLETISGLTHPTQEKDLSVLMLGHVNGEMFMLTSTELDAATGLQLEILNHGDLPFNGPGRNHLGMWGVSEIELLVQKPESTEWEKVKLVNATADFSEPENRPLDDKKEPGKKASGPVSFIIDGTDDTVWRADRGVGQRNQPSVAVVQFETPLTNLRGRKIKFVLRMNDMVGCFRLSLTDSPSPTAPSIDHAAILAMNKSPEHWKAVDASILFDAWRKTIDELKPINDQIAAKMKEFPNGYTSILHLREREPENARTTAILERGNWDVPKKPVQSGVPVAFHSMEQESAPERLKFARWLADEKSPLTSRVAVNRIWQSVFGLGLVETAEDFGTRTPIPAQKDVLDWLAAEFQSNGWSQKKLLKTILMSKAYQQTSHISPDLLAKDPRNILISRGPRFRAEAEVVRDIALTAAGLIHHRTGGNSFIPPVPQNVLDYNYTYPGYWKPTEGPDRYRRAVYAFRKRSMPDPGLSSFDSPNGDASCARRPRSNTPLAALTSLNEPIFFEAAQALGLRILREANKSEIDRINYGYLLCTGRPASDEERKTILQLLESRRKKIADGWINPREIITGDPGKLKDLPPETTPQDAAAWIIVSRVLLNLDETITKS